jgi:hypothetical protein
VLIETFIVVSLAPGTGEVKTVRCHSFSDITIGELPVPPRDERFRRGVRTATILTTATAAALTLSSCGVGALASHQAETTTPTVSQGDQFENGGLTYTVTNIWEQKTIGEGDNPLSEHVAQGMWFIVSIHTQNNSNDPQHFSAMFQTLMIDGKKFSPDVLASGDVSDKLHSDASLNPGFGGDLAVAFDVPENAFANATKTYLDLKGDMTSSETLVTLTKTVPGAPKG